MKVFLDTDIILDFLYERKDFFEKAAVLISLIEKGVVKGYISALIIWNLFYILSKYLGEAEARKKIKDFRKIIKVIAVDGKLIDTGLNSKIKDFEDSIQYYAAKSKGIEIFITRNIKDYPRDTISILTPSEFIASLIPDE